MTERLHGDDPRFGRLFAEIRTSWFRLETLQHYEAADESAGFEAFRFGGAVPRDPADHAWATLVRGHVSAGRALRRVHVIVEPLSDYVKYELVHGYRAGLIGGEDIRIVVTDEDSWPSGVPQRHDFWFLDNDLWIMSYDRSGRLEYSQKSEDPSGILKHGEWRDVALAASTPAADYIAAKPELRSRTAS
jgi:hypothetical protein